MNNIENKEKGKMLKYLKRIEKDLIELLNMKLEELTLTNRILNSKMVSTNYLQKHINIKQ